MPKCKSIKRLIPATCAWLLLITTTIVFFVFPGRRLQEELHYSICIAQGVITFFVISNFFATTFVDPGIIKRASPNEDNDDFRAPIYKEVHVRGQVVRMKWCSTCQFYRPPRCSHCSVCNHCIETFDHHCPWVNNCIGRRNYRHFFFFLIFLTIHMITIFIWCLLHVLNHRKSMHEASVIVAIVLMVIISLLFIPIFGLSCFHIVLVARGRTTNEQVTGKFKGQNNPFSRGIFWNCIYTLCGPRYPGLYVAKTPNVEDEDSDSNVKVYMDNIPMDVQKRVEDVNYNITKSEVKSTNPSRMGSRGSQEFSTKPNSLPRSQNQREDSRYSINGAKTEVQHVVTMHQTENGTKETTFVALPSNSSKTFNDRPGIFSYYNNKISASPSKSTSINEISTHLKKSPMKCEKQGPEGGMVIYYSPDAGCISNSKFNSETELQKFKNIPIPMSHEIPALSSEFKYNDKFLKRPVPFMKALEITNKIDQSKQSTLTKSENSDNRKSQYEMNYEISV